MRAAVALLCLATAAFAYDGKYRDDPRLARIRKELPARYAEARKRVAAALSYKVPEFPLVLEDAGKDRSGVMAETRKGPVIVLKTEYLVLDAHDLDKTLVHELVHCMQRKLGGHAKLPAWAREGMALYVAGQTRERARELAIFASSDRAREDPVDLLIDGLEGPHDLLDYAEDGFAFEMLEKHVGARRMPSLLFRLCRDGQAALPMPVAKLDRLTEAHADAHIHLLVWSGRKAFLEKKTPPLGTIYSGLWLLEFVEAVARRGHLEQARLVLLADPSHITRRAVLGRLSVLELHIATKAEFPAAAARAKKDLEPFVEYDEALAIIASRGGTRAPSRSPKGR